jgi:large subunit ribosomal protein L21
VKKINEAVKNDETGRLFAIIHLCGKQFKVTPGDIILVEGYWEPSNGDQLRLEKVLLCGSQDFTLIGRPILQKGLVDVQATVIEKSLQVQEAKAVQKNKFSATNHHHVTNQLDRHHEPRR